MRILAKACGFISFFVAILLISALLNVVLHRNSITREALGLDRNFDEGRCRDFLPAFSRPGKMISEKVAEEYFPYALIALNSYDYPDNKEFTYDRLIEYWKREGRDTGFAFFMRGERDGLNFIVYKTEYKPTKVIVGIRGTIPTSFWDWFSNFSWFTGLIPVQNHYDIARLIMTDIRRSIDDTDANYVVVGHSLGGGLARHLAAGFPCTSPVVIDTSFVSNEFLYKSPFTQYRSVHLFERDDELTKLRAILLGAERDGIGYRWYPLNLIDCDPSGAGEARSEGCIGRLSKYFCKNFQHSMRNIAVGMSRIVVDCQVNEPEGCGYNVSRSQGLGNLYCETYGKSDELCAKRPR